MIMMMMMIIIYGEKLSRNFVLCTVFGCARQIRYVTLCRCLCYFSLTSWI